MSGAKPTYPARRLAPGQACQVWVHDCAHRENTLVYETDTILLEAPNWDAGGLILNGDGRLWRLDLGGRGLREIVITGCPPLNNDHVLDPDGAHIYISCVEDWHIYRAPLAGGAAVRITGGIAGGITGGIAGASGPPGLMHFLHGVAPDGGELAFVGVQAKGAGADMRFASAEIYTIGRDGQGLRQITHGGVPADGPEYSPDGAWIYFNTEAFSGHAQIARMGREGQGLAQLTVGESVDWFPHIAPNGRSAVYLAYPPGTRGHPADLPVELRLVAGDDWEAARPIAQLFGGQGTINVNSWNPSSTHFAFVAYPIKG